MGFFGIGKKKWDEKVRAAEAAAASDDQSLTDKVMEQQQWEESLRKFVRTEGQRTQNNQVVEDTARNTTDAENYFEDASAGGGQQGASEGVHVTELGQVAAENPQDSAVVSSEQSEDDEMDARVQAYLQRLGLGDDNDTPAETAATGSLRVGLASSRLGSSQEFAAPKYEGEAAAQKAAPQKATSQEAEPEEASSAAALAQQGEGTGADTESSVTEGPASSAVAVDSAGVVEVEHFDALMATGAHPQVYENMYAVHSDEQNTLGDTRAEDTAEGADTAEKTDAAEAAMNSAAEAEAQEAAVVHAGAAEKGTQLKGDRFTTDITSTETIVGAEDTSLADSATDQPSTVHNKPADGEHEPETENPEENDPVLTRSQALYGLVQSLRGREQGQLTFDLSQIGEDMHYRLLSGERELEQGIVVPGTTWFTPVAALYVEAQNKGAVWNRAVIAVTPTESGCASVQASYANTNDSSTWDKTFIVRAVEDTQATDSAPAEDADAAADSLAPQRDSADGGMGTSAAAGTYPYEYDYEADRELRTHAEPVSNPENDSANSADSTEPSTEDAAASSPAVGAQELTEQTARVESTEPDDAQTAGTVTQGEAAEGSANTGAAETSFGAADEEPAPELADAGREEFGREQNTDGAVETETVDSAGVSSAEAVSTGAFTADTTTGGQAEEKDIDGMAAALAAIVSSVEQKLNRNVADSTISTAQPLEDTAGDEQEEPATASADTVPGETTREGITETAEDTATGAALRGDDKYRGGESDNGTTVNTAESDPGVSAVTTTGVVEKGTAESTTAENTALENSSAHTADTAHQVGDSPDTAQDTDLPEHVDDNELVPGHEQEALLGSTNTAPAEGDREGSTGSEAHPVAEEPTTAAAEDTEIPPAAAGLEPDTPAAKPTSVSSLSGERLAEGNLTLTEAQVAQRLAPVVEALFGENGTAKDATTVLIRVRSLGSYYDVLTHVRRNGFWEQVRTFELMPEEVLDIPRLKTDSYSEGDGSPLAMSLTFTPGVPVASAFDYTDEQAFVRYPRQLEAERYVEELRMFPRLGAKIPAHMAAALTHWNL